MLSSWSTVTSCRSGKPFTCRSSSSSMASVSRARRSGVSPATCGVRSARRVKPPAAANARASSRLPHRYTIDQPRLARRTPDAHQRVTEPEWYRPRCLLRVVRVPVQLHPADVIEIRRPRTRTVVAQTRHRARYSPSGTGADAQRLRKPSQRPHLTVTFAQMLLAHVDDRLVHKRMR